MKSRHTRRSVRARRSSAREVSGQPGTSLVRPVRKLRLEGRASGSMEAASFERLCSRYAAIATLLPAASPSGRAWQTVVTTFDSFIQLLSNRAFSLKFTMQI